MLLVIPPYISETLKEFAIHKIRDQDAIDSFLAVFSHAEPITKIIAIIISIGNLTEI